MSEEQLDERLRQAARAYHEPPDTPREAMWEAIAARRRASSPRRLGPWWTGRLGALAAAAAVMLAVGIGIGRISVSPEPAPGPEATVSRAEPAVNATAYRLAAEEHLGQSEAFLTLFRTSLEQRGDYRLASAAARQLLATNRLLLDSPASADRATRVLLEDLELVLAQIAQLSPGSRAEDLDLIRRGMERGQVMPRLRTAVPAGTGPNQGAS